MTFNNDMIKSILEEHIWDKGIYQCGKFQCGFDELVEGITVELNAMADTERRLRDIKSEEQMLLEEHQKAMHETKVARAEIVSQCRHHSTTYYPDPSGGSASSTTCDICGAMVSHVN